MTASESPNGSPSRHSLNTGSTKGACEVLLLYMRDCVNKFTDDMSIIGLMSGGHETAYGDEVQRLA